VYATQNLLHKLIKSPRADDTECKLITIAPSFAASAAANLLILGDYSILYPQSEVICHGSRYFEREITTDNTNIIENELRSVNIAHAQKIAEKVFDRLLFRVYLINREPALFEWATDDEFSPPMSDEYFNVISYLKAVSNKLSNEDSNRLGASSVSGKQFLEGVLESWLELNEVLTTAMSTDLEDVINPKQGLKALIEYELSRMGDHDPPYKLIERLQSDLNKISELPNLEGTASRLFSQSAVDFLTQNEYEEFKTLEGEEQNSMLKETSLERFSTMWHFTTHLCHRLNEQENTFTAVDCYLLGLVDEVCGLSYCVSRRHLEEE